MFTVYCGDAVEWARRYTGEPYHALLCDPPYHLTSIVKRFGKAEAAPAQFGRDGAFSRASRGFMGQQWDGGDVAFRPETWHEFGRILYPGAFGFAFASSRGWHRMAVAIEDAGFIIHPTLFLWAYGSGFPKATRIDHQVEALIKLGRTNPQAMREIRMGEDYSPTGQKDYAKGRKFSSEIPDDNFQPELSEEAQDWTGHRYGLQALKPAVEPIICFQKPYEGRPIENMLANGAGALNIDAGRISGAPWKWGTQTDIRGGGYGSKRPSDGDVFAKDVTGSLLGRWPANFLMQHAPGCEFVGYDKGGKGYTINRFTDGAKPFGGGAGHDYETVEGGGGYREVWKCADGCPVAALDKQSGKRKSGARKAEHAVGAAGEDGYMSNQVYGKYKARPYPEEAPALEQSASEFFFAGDWSFEVEEKLMGAEPVAYVPKANRSERDAGLEGVEERFAPKGNHEGRDMDNPKNHLGGLQGAKMRNFHPTVKPIALTRYLASLLLPPDKYAPRRLFVPFAGVGSEVIGGMRAGWDVVDGVELTQDYVPLANQRVRYWETHAAPSKKGKVVVNGNMMLFEE